MVAMQRMVQLSVSTSAAATSSYGVSSSCKGVEVVISDLFPDGLRVLVVDDDITCLRILEEMLRRCLYIEFVVYLLDKTIASSAKGREIGNEKLSGILDLQQVTYKNVDARGLIAGFQFLQAYFPERLAKYYILHMPRFFVSIWRMGSRFIEKATLEKIVVVTNEDEKKSFIEEIGEEAVPVEYGGKAKLTVIQDVEVPPLEG